MHSLWGEARAPISGTFFSKTLVMIPSFDICFIFSFFRRPWGENPVLALSSGKKTSVSWPGAKMAEIEHFGRAQNSNSGLVWSLRVMFTLKMLQIPWGVQP